jgi:hypothetical protein
MKKILSSLTLLALSACTPVSPPDPSPVPPPSETAVPSPPAAAPISSLEQARQQVAAHLLAGRHEEALAVLVKERRSSRAQQFLQEEYLQVLRELAREGDKLFQGGEFERSGQKTRLIVDHYPQDQAVADRLEISLQELQDRLELCAEGLMAQGLREYRAANLTAAIDIWRKVLAFHGTHEGARRGIQTAETQLQNLRALQ